MQFVALLESAQAEISHAPAYLKRSVRAMNGVRGVRLMIIRSMIGMLIVRALYFVIRQVRYICHDIFLIYLICVNSYHNDLLLFVLSLLQFTHSLPTNNVQRLLLRLTMEDARTPTKIMLLARLSLLWHL